MHAWFPSYNINLSHMASSFSLSPSMQCMDTYINYPVQVVGIMIIIIITCLCSMRCAEPTEFKMSDTGFIWLSVIHCTVYSSSCHEYILKVQNYVLTVQSKPHVVFELCIWSSGSYSATEQKSTFFLNFASTLILTNNE